MDPSLPPTLHSLTLLFIPISALSERNSPLMSVMYIVYANEDLYVSTYRRTKVSDASCICTYDRVPTKTDPATSCPRTFRFNNNITTRTDTSFRVRPLCPLRVLFYAYTVYAYV